MWGLRRTSNLASESVEGSALSLESIDDVHSSDSLSSGVLSVGHSISDDVLEEYLQYSSGFFVDESRNSFHSSSSCQSSNSWLGDALNVVSEDLSVSLGSSLSKSFTTFSSSSHCNKKITAFVSKLKVNVYQTNTNGQWDRAAKSEPNKKSKPYWLVDLLATGK